MKALEETPGPSSFRAAPRFDKRWPLGLCSATMSARPFGFVILAVLGALAVVGPAAAKRRTDPALRQAQIREVLVALDLAPGGDALTLGPRGRRDLVVFSPRPHAEVTAVLTAAYANGRALPHGYHVAGYAHLVQSDTTTFTFKNTSGDAWVVELADAGVGSRLVIWGVGRDLVPERRPRAELPMRLLSPTAP